MIGLLHPVPHYREGVDTTVQGRLDGIARRGVFPAGTDLSAAIRSSTPRPSAAGRTPSGRVTPAVGGIGVNNLGATIAAVETPPADATVKGEMIPCRRIQSAQT
jgi:hypothetical protein